MTTERHRVSGRLADRVAELLADARDARDGGRWHDLRALAGAALTLDPGNAEAEALLAGSAERCQMTLMFCDVVGSTAISDTHDPEEFGEILREFRAACAEVIERFGGFIEDHQGDGMLVRFGFPEVHEDDARRAVLSGLEMVRAVHARDQRLHERFGVDLRVRVAVHTDLVVLDGGMVTGLAPNEASRLQAVAEPDSVVISDATHALVRDDFEVEPIGLVELRGMSRPVAAFKVLRERATRRLATGTELTAFAGRRRERARIEELWRAACEDLRGAAAGADVPAARALLVVGPPGIGKSRLVHEAARGLGAACLECRCSSYHEATSLFAFRRVLEQACGIVEEDAADARLAKLRDRLGEGPDLPFLAAALRIPASSLSPPTAVDPGRLRELALAAAARLVHVHSGTGPSILFVDDLHWADPSSLDLISALLGARRPGLVLVLAARDAFAPPWPEAIVPRLELGPLPAQDLARMVESIPAGAELPGVRRAGLISRSDGVPLFLEELVHTADAVDRGQALHRSVQQARYAIPPALRDPLLARLTVPGVDLRLAQLASTIGRDVDLELLREISGLPEAPFAQRLETLVAAGLVDRSSAGAIRFRHELIRELAYETQRRSERPGRHSRVADVLLRDRDASRYRDAGEAAFHLELAQRHQEAIHAHLTAAQGAQELGAHKEATTSLTRAVELTPHLADRVTRDRTELLVRQLRSFSAVMASGYAAPAAAEDHGRCVALCEALGLGPELIPSLISSWSYYAFRGELDAADHVTDTMERGFETGRVNFPLAFAGRGIVDFFRGRFGEARRLMEAFVEHPWGQTANRPRPSWPLPNDPLACVIAHLVPTLWIAGEQEAAEEMARRALHRVEGLDFPFGPFSAGYVHSLLAVTHRLDGDHAAAARHARAMLALGERHGFVMWTLAGAIQARLSQVHAGEREVLEVLVASVDAWRHVLVAEVWTPYWLTALADAQRAVGRREDALRSLDEALKVAGRTGSDFCSAEALRVRGELRHELGDRGGLADLQAAVDRARRQDAAVFELRSAISLAHATTEASAHEALETAIGHARGTHPRELDEARSLAAS